MSGKKILLVDDEPHVIRSLKFVLEKQGYETDFADNGEDAVNKVREFRPDLILLDIMMPKKDGYDVCQEIKNDPDLKDTYVIILTAKGQERDRIKAFESHADEYITKPFSPSGLLSRLKELLS